jgi:hypothetical protein
MVTLRAYTTNNSNNKNAFSFQASCSKLEMKLETHKNQGKQTPQREMKKIKIGIIANK